MSMDDAAALALSALGWVLSDENRATRLLDLSGLAPDDLRARLDDPAVLAAILGFLARYEPDLIAAARDLNIDPAALVRAQEILDS